MISADSHPVAGAFVFNVKKANAGSCKQVFGAKTPGTIDALFKFARGLDFALILLVVGGAIALAVVLRSAAVGAPHAVCSGSSRACPSGSWSRRRSASCSRAPWPEASASSEAFRWDTIHSVLQTRFGRAFLWQIGVAIVVGALAMLASRSRKLELLPLLALLLLPTVSAAGHARTSGALAIFLDVFHIAAASTWVGGLAFTILGLLLAGEDRWPLASRAVPRFSLLAVVSVATLIVAGSLRGYQEVKAFHGLWDTTYGRLLLVKIALVLPLLALGAYNNRYAVPRLKKQIASVVEQRRFLRAAGTELAIMAIIVGVTAVLVTEPPAKASVSAAKYATDTVPIGPLEVNYLIDPAKTGPNVIHLYFFDEERPAGERRRREDVGDAPEQEPRPAADPAHADRPQPLHDVGRSLPGGRRLAGDVRDPPRPVPVVHPDSHRSHQRGLTHA